MPDAGCGERGVLFFCGGVIQEAGLLSHGFFFFDGLSGLSGGEVLDLQSGLLRFADPPAGDGGDQCALNCGMPACRCSGGVSFNRSTTSYTDGSFGIDVLASRL